MILADRYTTSNAYHQATKLKRCDWPGYFAWLEETEYEKLSIPRPGLVFYLDVPLDISRKLISARYGGDESKRDIHEANFAYLTQCREAALAAAMHFGWTVIDCTKDNKLRSIGEIHDSIREHIRARITD